MAYTICLNGHPITESAWTLESEAEAAMQRLIASELQTAGSLITPEALEVLPCETDHKGFALPPTAPGAKQNAAQFGSAMWSEQVKTLQTELALTDSAGVLPSMDDSTMAIVAALLVQPHIDRAAELVLAEADKKLEAEELERLVK